jgi:hypothetical protein
MGKKIKLTGVIHIGKVQRIFRKPIGKSGSVLGIIQKLTGALAIKKRVIYSFS